MWFIIAFAVSAFLLIKFAKNALIDIAHTAGKLARWIKDGAK